MQLGDWRCCLHELAIHMPAFSPGPSTTALVVHTLPCFICPYKTSKAGLEPALPPGPKDHEGRAGGGGGGQCVLVPPPY